MLEKQTSVVGQPILTSFINKKKMKNCQPEQKHEIIKGPFNSWSANIDVNSFEYFGSYYLIVTHVLISVAETSALKHFSKYSPQPQYRKGKLLSINLKIEKG